MTENELKSRLRDFSLRVIRLCSALPSTPAGRAIGNQLIRSGTSPGANYRAACRARSRADFVAKLAICEEEIDESGYWLDLIMAGGLLPVPRVMPLYQKSDELTAILSSSRITARTNGHREKAPLPSIENRKSKIKNLREAP